MKMNKKCSLALSLLLILFFFPMVASGQEITVKGKVIEKETGDPLPGVSIVVEKSTKGVISDLDGSYEIKVRAADKLVYSFIGKQTQTIAVGGRTKIDVALIKATKADKYGNLYLDGTTKNISLQLALAADTVIVETNELVEVGEIDPNDIYIPGILVDYVVQGLTPQEHHQMMGDLWTETKKLAGVK